MLLQVSAVRFDNESDCLGVPRERSHTGVRRGPGWVKIGATAPVAERSH